jgi:putative ferrous iron transport protein C
VLSEIKGYLMDRKRATLGELALHFDIEPEAVRGMLEHWVRKGRVLKSDSPAGCSHGCSQCCDASSMEIYEWIEPT